MGVNWGSDTSRALAGIRMLVCCHDRLALSLSGTWKQNEPTKTFLRQVSSQLRRRLATFEHGTLGVYTPSV